MTPREYGVSALQLPFLMTAIPKILKEALHRGGMRVVGCSWLTPAIVVSVRAAPGVEAQAWLLAVWAAVPVGILLSSAIAAVYWHQSNISGGAAQLVVFLSVHSTAQSFGGSRRGSPAGCSLAGWSWCGLL